MFSDAMRGQRFCELIFSSAAYVEQAIPHLAKVGLHPTKAAKRLNAEVGRVVCEVRDGILKEYSDVGGEKKVMVHLKGIGLTPFYLTVIKVVYTDEHEGFSYRVRSTILRSS